MTDYATIPYFQLKAECKKRGLNSEGKKTALIERLYEADGITTEAPIKEEPKQEILTEVPDELSHLLPKSEATPARDTSKFEPWLVESRMSELEGKLTPLAAGRGKVSFTIDRNKGVFLVHFRGGAEGDVDMTLIAPDNVIVHQATRYFKARLATGGNGQTSRL